MECVYIVFFTVNSSVNAARSSPLDFSPSLCGVAVRYSRVEPMVPGSSLTQYLILFPSFFFFPCFVLLFSINVHLNNCYLIECN